jgi:hypothetical protein
MNCSRILAAVIAATVMLLAAPVAQAATFIQWQGQPGDRISGGGSGRGESPAEPISAFLSSGGVLIAGTSHDWQLEFRPVAGQPFTVGTYTAVQQPSSGPYLRVHGLGHDCGTNFTAQFTILEITFDTVAGTLTSFAADLRMRCGGAEANLAVGVRFNSSIPYAPPDLTYTTPSFVAWTSQPGDVVGQGTSGTVTHANGCFSAVPTFGTVPTQQIGVEVFFFDFSQCNPSGSFQFATWGLGFWSANGQPLGPGTYPMAASNTPGLPGLDVVNTSCSAAVTGQFTVYEIEYDVNGTPTRLAIDFEQHCNGAAAGLFGGVRFNSTYPYTPAAAAGPVTITFNPPSVTVATGADFDIGVNVTFPSGAPASNLPLTLSYNCVGGTAGTQACLRQVVSFSQMTDASGHATFHGTANAFGGSYTVNVYGAGVSQSATVTQVAPAPPPPPPPPPAPASGPDTSHLQDMWWNSSENGWGMSLVQHNDTLFGALYIYDRNGKPIWVVLPGGSWDSTHTRYSGSVYKPIGTPFYAYSTQGLHIGDPIGNISITFQDANNAILDYTIAGVTGRKLVTREIFATGAAISPNRSDLWWGGTSQNGWGVTLLQQANTIFGVWYTYDANNDPFWYVMPGGTWTSADTYEGTLYRTTGSGWVESPYDASKLTVINAGTFKFQFSGDNSTFTYAADGHSGTIELAREPF